MFISCFVGNVGPGPGLDVRAINQEQCPTHMSHMLACMVSVCGVEREVYTMASVPYHPANVVSLAEHCKLSAQFP